MVDAPNLGSPPVYKSPDSAPIIYFDGIAAFGVMNGAVQIEIACRKLIPLPDGSTSVEFFCGGHLRCSPAAATQLREAVDKALEMLQRPPEEPTVASSKLN